MAIKFLITTAQKKGSRKTTKNLVTHAVSPIVLAEKCFYHYMLYIL